MRLDAPRDKVEAEAPTHRAAAASEPALRTLEEAFPRRVASTQSVSAGTVSAGFFPAGRYSEARNQPTKAIHISPVVFSPQPTGRGGWCGLLGFSGELSGDLSVGGYEDQ